MNSLKNSLLISVPHMNDDIFKNSVIYICEHNLDGAMGLIINKPTDDISYVNQKNPQHTSSDYFENLKMKLYFGGPVLVEKIIVLHTNELSIGSTIILNDKISISSGEEILGDIEKDKNFNYKLFYGHCGWTAGQLEAEIENGDWLLQSSKIDLLFNLPAEKIWKNSIKSLGVNVIDISNMSGRA
jgi:putative transcriptional regulator|tara:strand:- start:401 stop:955 length:555 start_codon:yes stop_codon:yes gene_type:complete